MYSNTAVVQFSPITYTVTEGLDEFAVLQLIRSGVLTGSSVVTVTTLQDTVSGMNSIQMLTKSFYLLLFKHDTVFNML